MTAAFKEKLASNAKQAENKLQEKLSFIKLDAAFENYKRLYESMEYSLMAGGKRLRPCLVMEFARLFGGDKAACSALDFASSLEMVHTFSLIHDDMPCMDNDDLRRGKPTNHKVFGEDCALLAGDSLLAYAFEVMPSKALSDRQNLDAMLLLAKCTGPTGMCAGQQIDLENEGKNIDADMLRTLHDKKTGALIRCACLLGCIAAGKDSSTEEYGDALTYANAIGLSFQITDDILDVVGDAKKLGKNCGSDAKDLKNTYVTLFGIEKSKELAHEQTRIAVEAIKKYDGNEFLTQLAEYITERDS